ncbi:MAG: DciA family protein [Waterburya sp.]
MNSVEQILAKLEQQPGWEKFTEYRQLLKCWENTVHQNTFKHTRPLHITRQVLWVATSSAARAQELSFQRYTLLKRLNKKLPFILKDIRFSSSGWHQKTYQSENQANLFIVSSQYKSTVVDPPSTITGQETENSVTKSSPNKAKSAAKRWLKTLKQPNSSLLSCPGCTALTPRGEIERWNLCYHCIAQKWSKEYRPPTFPEPK